MEKQLPKNWIEVQLIDILEVLENGSRPKGGVQGIFDGVPSLGGEHLNSNGGFKFGKLKYVPTSFAEKMNRGKIKENDILIVKDGATTGKTSFIDNNFPFDLAFVNEHVFICRTFPNLNSKCVFYFLFGKSGFNRIMENFTGSAQGGINQKFARNTLIPLPPLAEQNRIVYKLDKMFSQLETIKAALINIPLLLKDFRQQVLTQAVTGKLTEEWRKGKELERTIDTTIGQLFEVKTGSTPKRGTSIYYDNATIPWLKSGQVRNEFIYEADEFITEIAVKDTNAKIYPVDSILVAMYGEGKTRGQVGWTKIEAASNQAIAALVNINMKLVTKKYVYNFCLSQYNEIRAQAEGGNQPNLNLSKIKNWKIKLPSDIEQQEIVSRVESLFAKADAIEQQYKTLKACIDNVPQAILHKAFKGELTEQLDSDGDAKELLEEIKALKYATGKVIKSKTQISKAKKVKNYPEEDGVLDMVAEHQ